MEGEVRGGGREVRSGRKHGWKREEGDEDYSKEKRTEE